jgi:hypothetical protein
MDDNIANRFETQMRMKKINMNTDLEQIENDLQLTLSNILLNYSDENIKSIYKIIKIYPIQFMRSLSKTMIIISFKLSNFLLDFTPRIKN